MAGGTVDEDAAAPHATAAPGRRRAVLAWLGPQGVVIVGIALAVVIVGVALAAVAVDGRRGDLRVGAVRDPEVSSPAPGPTTLPTVAATGAPGTPAAAAAADVPVEDGPGIVGGARRRRAPSGARLLDPRGRPYGAPVPFDATIPVPDGLVWVLAIGSDARPGEDPLRARADSIHLLAGNPETGDATVVGIPRDAYVEIPGHGSGKINQALVLGGPELLAKAVNRLLGLPVQWWALASFTTFASIVDEVGGVDVYVPQRMDDKASGAYFEKGWHHMDGRQALAFSRDRHDFADGDLQRSRNQGEVVLAALAKLRAEVGDEAGLRRWVGVAFRHLALEGGLGRDEALELMGVARRTVHGDATNLVLQGRAGTVRGESVVLLDAAAAAEVADDLRPDAAIGAPRPEGPTTTTTAPPADPEPTVPEATQPSTTSTTARPGVSVTTSSTAARPRATAP